jgi:tetratricopeptide (TPR) repeat protein
MTTQQKEVGLWFALYITGDPEEADLQAQIENYLKQQGIALSVQTYNVNSASSETVDLERVDVVLLLVSPFFPREYFAHQDMQLLLQRQQAGNLCIIPILIRPTAWFDLPFAHIQALPRSERDGVKPLSLWRNRGLAISKILADIKAMTSNFMQGLLNRFSLSLDAILMQLASHPSDDEQHAIAEQLFAACQRIIPLSPQTAGELFFQLGELAAQLEPDDYVLAQQCYEHGIDLCKQVFGPTSKETIQNLRGLARLHQQHGQFEKAEEYIQQLLRIYSQLKPESEDRLLLAILLFDENIAVITTEAPQTINFLLRAVVEKLTHPLQSSFDAEMGDGDVLRQIFEGMSINALCLLDTNDDISLISFDGDPEKARAIMLARLNQYLQS